jgi:hypothetical protein
MIKTYRPLLIHRILIVFILLFDAVIFSLFLLFLNRLQVLTPFTILIAVLFLGFFLFGISSALQIRLEISDHGIKYFSGYYTISTSWDNVERVGIGVPNSLLNFPVEGLVLRTASASKPSLVASIFLSSGMGFYKVDYSRSIPLQGMWSWNWRKSELAKDLKRYLPNLL